MRSPDDTPSGGARARRALAATLLLGALVTLPAASASCGEDAASSSPAVQVAAPSSSPDAEPTTAAGAVCDRTTADRKPLPGPARVTIERFIAAVDRGDRKTMLALLDPAVAGKILTGLRPVSRLGLLELEDRY